MYMLSSSYLKDLCVPVLPGKELGVCQGKEGSKLQTHDKVSVSVVVGQQMKVGCE